MSVKLPTELNTAEEILQIWKENRKTVLENLDSINEETLLTRPDGGWSLSEVAEHLYLTQLNIARVLPAVLSGKVGSPVGKQEDLDFRKMRIGLARPTGFKNPENLSPLKNYPRTELYSLLDKSDKKLTENLRGKTKPELEVRGLEHPAFGLLNLFNFLWVMALHEGLHSYAIRQRVSQIRGN